MYRWHTNFLEVMIYILTTTKQDHKSIQGTFGLFQISNVPCVHGYITPRMSGGMGGLSYSLTFHTKMRWHNRLYGRNFQRWPVYKAHLNMPVQAIIGILNSSLHWECLTAYSKRLLYRVHCE